MKDQTQYQIRRAEVYPMKLAGRTVFSVRCRQRGRVVFRRPSLIMGSPVFQVKPGSMRPVIRGRVVTTCENDVERAMTMPATDFRRDPLVVNSDGQVVTCMSGVDANRIGYTSAILTGDKIIGVRRD